MTTEDDNKQLRATIGGLRAKVSELQKQHDDQRLVIQDQEKRVMELERQLRMFSAPVSPWLDSGQGQL